jgi:hypothetical protein
LLANEVEYMYMASFSPLLYLKRLFNLYTRLHFSLTRACLSFSYVVLSGFLLRHLPRTKHPVLCVAEGLNQISL